MIIKLRPKDSILVLCMNPRGTHSQQGIFAAAIAFPGLTRPDRMVAGGKKAFLQVHAMAKEGRENINTL